MRMMTIEDGEEDDSLDILQNIKLCELSKSKAVAAVQLPRMLKSREQRSESHDPSNPQLRSYPTQSPTGSKIASATWISRLRSNRAWETHCPRPSANPSQSGKVQANPLKLTHNHRKLLQSRCHNRLPKTGLRHPPRSLREPIPRTSSHCARPVTHSDSKTGKPGIKRFHIRWHPASLVRLMACIFFLARNSKSNRVDCAGKGLVKRRH